jgi:hypothetical protein
VTLSNVRLGVISEHLGIARARHTFGFKKVRRCYGTIIRRLSWPLDLLRGVLDLLPQETAFKIVVHRAAVWRAV